MSQDADDNPQPAADDPAAAAFAHLAKSARARIDPRRFRPTPGVGRQYDQPKRRRRWAGPGPSARDPKPVMDVFNQLAKREGWAGDLQRGRVLSQWPSVVGEDIAAKTTPISLADGKLVVEAASTAWATELGLMKRVLHQRIDSMVGVGVVRVIEIRGPAAPSWKKGPRSVRGRGPRDTYG